jgi:hypothetical protein
VSNVPVSLDKKAVKIGCDETCTVTPITCQREQSAMRRQGVPLPKVWLQNLRGMFTKRLPSVGLGLFEQCKHGVIPLFDIGCFFWPMFRAMKP